MAKPPPSTPHSDMDGVHRDGTRPSKPLPTKRSGGSLQEAGEEDAARPDYTNEESTDDRTR